MRCPKCGSSEIRRSRRSSLREYLLSAFLLLPYRCRACTQRFLSSEERVHKLRYAHCPRCGTYELQTISSRHVPVRWLKTLQRSLRPRAYRCDACRWRFFDLRPLSPQHPTSSSSSSSDRSDAKTHAASGS